MGGYEGELCVCVLWSDIDCTYTTSSSFFSPHSLIHHQHSQAPLVITLCSPASGCTFKTDSAQHSTSSFSSLPRSSYRTSTLTQHTAPTVTTQNRAGEAAKRRCSSGTERYGAVRSSTKEDNGVSDVAEVTETRTRRRRWLRRRSGQGRVGCGRGRRRRRNRQWRSQR